MANPPFNLSNWGQEKLKDDVRWQFGTHPLPVTPTMRGFNI